jgi:hypothetical protein
MAKRNKSKAIREVLVETPQASPKEIAAVRHRSLARSRSDPTMFCGSDQSPDAVVTVVRLIDGPKMESR